MESTKASPDVKAILASMSPDDRAKVETAMKKVASKRKTEAEVRKDYPHVIEGSMGFDEKAQKQTVKITCTVDGCSEIREVFTSDLFQVRVCMGHRKEQKSLARKARRAEEKALIEKGKAVQG